MTISARPSKVAPWIEGLLLASLVTCVLALGGETVRASYHGFLHTTLGEAVLRDGLLPENPYHAGVALRYYTLYPTLGVLFGRLGLGPLWGFAALNALAALLLAPALDALGRALGLGFAARRFAFLAAVLGFNGLGWIGFAFLRHSMEWGGPPVFLLMPMSFQETAIAWDPRLQAFLPKFLNVSSFAVALPFALWALAGAGVTISEASANLRRSLFRISLPLALALALNPIVGGFAALCLLVWVAATLWRSQSVDRRAAIGDAHSKDGGQASGPILLIGRLHWSLVGLATILLAAPFLLPALQPAPDGEALTGGVSFGSTVLGNMFGPTILLLLAAGLGWRRITAAMRWRWSFAAGLALLTVGLGELPWGNEYKMGRMAGVLLALPAGLGLAALWARGKLWRGIVVVLGLLVLPTSWQTLDAYLAWGSQSEAMPFEFRAGRWMPVEDGPVSIPDEIFQAISEAQDEPLIVIDLVQAQTQLGRGSLVQGHALAPALDVPLFVDRPHTLNDQQPDLQQRLDWTYALFHGLRWPRDESSELLDSRRLPRGEALRRIRERFPQRRVLVLAREDRIAMIQGTYDPNQPAEAMARKRDAIFACLRAAGAQALVRDSGVILLSLDPLRAAAAD